MTLLEPAWIERAPAPALRPWIDSYHGYCYAATGGLHRGLPSRHLTCIVSIGEPIEVVSQTDPRQSPDTYRFVLSGLQARHALIANEGVQRGVAIELAPIGARWLLDMPELSAP